MDRGATHQNSDGNRGPHKTTPRHGIPEFWGVKEKDNEGVLGEGVWCSLMNESVSGVLIKVDYTVMGPESLSTSSSILLSETLSDVCSSCFAIFDFGRRQTAASLKKKNLNNKTNRSI